MNKEKTKLCVCGGGNLGHVVAGFVASRPGFEVSLLTRHPERWSNYLIIDRPDGWNLVGKLNRISSDPKEVVAGADIVLLCLPGYSIRNVLLQIRDCLGKDTVVGSIVSSTGFFFQAMEVLPPSTPLFGLQRVPFIARTTEYGHKASLLGYKENLCVAVEQTWRKEEMRQTMERMFNTPTKLMANFYEVSLSNSNPLLHTSRLYSLWKDWQKGMTYDHIPMFYEEWTDEAAQLYIDMDREFQALLSRLPVSSGSIPSVLDYYESTDASSLARKLRSIKAFKGIKAPMVQAEGGFVPDLQSRYFTEDFPYGLAFIHRLAHEKGVDIPVIDTVMEWDIVQALNFRFFVYNS
ncbi:MAG: NAD/NADP octopine/nopaline dehydrogenase family protein [Prevotella sp.]|nr:NAD/NADP octopine/nopaline dehydrogenase family protein [Prevotella sp.]